MSKTNKKEGEDEADEDEDEDDEEIVFAVRSGSHLYNLSVGSSDEDYDVVFLGASTKLAARALRPPRRQFEVHDSAGAGYGGSTTWWRAAAEPAPRELWNS